jgi:hypothetical protein
MIDVKQAVANATQFLVATLGEGVAGSVRLEEVELSPDDKYWQITLSFLKRGYVPSPAMAVSRLLGQADDPREYKQFQVDAWGDGKVRSMKIRQLA